ncbi:MAG TPA: response regulator [Allocoleopsis sp.]
MKPIDKTILVIEDDALILENLEELLSENYRVIACSGGRVGLETAKKELPDLVLCDITMAGVTGYNILTELRLNPVTAKIPFIFLTALGTKDDIRVGKNLGADAYLVKPYTQKDLLNCIAAHLKTCESSVV